MKRKVFAIGAVGMVAIALLALPHASTQAESEMVEKVAITVEEGCTFIAEPDDETMRAVTIGQGSVAKDIDGVTFNVTCNGREFNGTWEITAQGQGGGKMTDGAGHEISSTEGELTGEASNWAMKMNVTGAAKIPEGYLDYTQVPTEPTKVASNTGEAASGDATIKAQYGVSVEKDQEAGAYTGQVVYTLSNAASD